MTLVDNLKREIKVRRDHPDDYDEEITLWIEQAADRIEALEAALREIADKTVLTASGADALKRIARAALEPEQDK